MSAAELKDSAAYAPKDMPPLKSLLDSWQTAGLTCRIHVRSGTPHYWYGNRCVRHVHANLSLKNGRAVTRSKSLTDAVMAMPVTRWTFDRINKSADVIVFSLYGRKKRRPEKTRDQGAGSMPEDTAHGRYIAMPTGIEDELPFN